MFDKDGLIVSIKNGDQKSLAKCLSLVENDLPGYDNLLMGLVHNRNIPVVGITGSPGSGKSTLVNSIIKKLSGDDQKIGILAIDPTSPFNFGTLLGDRIRMREHFTDGNIFIRSVATRGALGGLSARIIEMLELMKTFPFDLIIIETVGVGQSEIDIAGVAHTTILVFVPEAGDEIQLFKSGIMEIADIFVINKCDRQGADAFERKLKFFIQAKKNDEWIPPVIKTIATVDSGTNELIKNIRKHDSLLKPFNEKTVLIFAEKAYRLLQKKRMKDIDKTQLVKDISIRIKQKNFNIFSYIENWNIH